MRWLAQISVPRLRHLLPERVAQALRLQREEMHLPQADRRQYRLQVRLEKIGRAGVFSRAKAARADGDVDRPAYTGRSEAPCRCRYQAALLCSEICGVATNGDDEIAIRRGFIASGSSR